ncbi:MAG: WYL domain-containing protein [Ruminococcus sp.]|nr:WYL domain-containing protein [Ruminococcus sp.]
MGGFSELIKSFDKTRDYIRDFFIYGLKVRNDFDRKSLRTYDDEKRRIESWFGDYVKYDRSERGQKVSITVDSGTVSENPLYKAYRSKSFTDNDIKLHFFIIDVLHNGESLTLKEIVSDIDKNYNEIFDVQTIRNKLKEYVKEGIITSGKKGKASCFRLSTDRVNEFLHDYDGLADAIKFFSETQKFGIVGNSILESARLKNNLFVMKHNYIVHTLEDIIIPEIISAIEQKKYISIISFKAKNNKINNNNQVIPMKIFSSVQTGRRYIVGYIPAVKCFHSFRLDFIKSVRTGDICDEYDSIYEKFSHDLNYCFGVSFGSGKIETTVIVFFADEKCEKFVIDRLKREKRNGVLEKIDDNLFRLTVKAFDSFEVMQWVKSFTGRIISVTGDNKYAIDRFYNDISKMYSMYGGEEQ